MNDIKANHASIYIYIYIYSKHTVEEWSKSQSADV